MKRFVEEADRGQWTLSFGCCGPARRDATYRAASVLHHLHNRFVRWRRAGVWSRIMDALAAAHDAAVQMIDTSIVRVHQHGACILRRGQSPAGVERG